MPHFKNNIFLLNSPKIKLFLQKKCKIFERWGLRPQTLVTPAAGGFAPRPPAFSNWGLSPQTPKLAPPPIVNFWLYRFLFCCISHFMIISLKFSYWLEPALKMWILIPLNYTFRQWWASYFLKVTSYKLQLLGKKSN